MNGGSAHLLDFWRCFFFNRRNYNLHALRARRIEHEEGKFAIAGDYAYTLWICFQDFEFTLHT